jgi:hypothetical protein
MLCADPSKRISTMQRVQEEIRAIRLHLESAHSSQKSIHNLAQPVSLSKTYPRGVTRPYRLLWIASFLILTILVSKLWVGNVFTPPKASSSPPSLEMNVSNVLVSIAPIQHPTDWIDREKLLEKLESGLREQFVRERGFLFRSEDKAFYRIEPSVSMLPPHSAQITLLVRRISTGAILFGESLVGKREELSRMLHNLSEMLIHRLAQIRPEKPSP